MNGRKICVAGILAIALAATPALVQSAVSVEITVAPPVPRVEVVPPPRPGYVWGPGYWRWDGHRHVWAEGRWMRARHGNVWVPEHWNQKGNHWVFVPGHWAHG